MTALWTGKDMAAAMGGRPVGDLPGTVTGISIDSRSLVPGEAFFAIKGENSDGHDFATAAVRAGASVLVVSEARLPALGRLTVPLIVVDDVLDALVKLGIAARARTGAKIIAVTGSAGKTTTKEALRHVLSACGRVHASAASFNNHWGVPLTLARMPADTEFGVFEIGMNHAGEITPLVAMVRPHVAIVTLIAAAHLGHFSSLDDIAAAKAEIFTGVVEGGHALINHDDERYGMLADAARKAGIGRVTGYGTGKNAPVRIVEPDYGAESTTGRIRIDGREWPVTIGMPGRHIALNALAVVAAAQLAGADLDVVTKELASLSAGAGRGQRLRLAHPEGEIVLIDESYNANPASMRAALALLAATNPGPGGRRIAVLGDMLELGAFSHDLHAELAEPVRQSRADLVFLGGPEMTALAEALGSAMAVHHREGADEVSKLVMTTLHGGDVVMVKSSKGVKFSRIVKAISESYPPTGADAARLS